jgi:hypothetical protein
MWPVGRFRALVLVQLHP